MALELVYTSATRGLRPGTSGFCTVAMTRGLPPALVPRLEALGGYRPGPTGEGPIARSFWRVETASGVAHVLSVVGPAPPDHTQRTNKIATYLVLGGDELDDAGPAWMLSQPGAMRERWSGAPAWIEEAARAPRGGPAATRICEAWRAACGDAGWAGVLASAFLRDQGKPVHVIYPAGVDALALVDDAMHLLPSWARWRATFTTYFLQPVAGTPCIWRFCLEGTPGADLARQSKGLVIDLTRPVGEAAESRFVRMARTGVDPEAAAEAARASGTRERARAESGRSAAAVAEIGIEAAVKTPPVARERFDTVRPRGLGGGAGDVPERVPAEPALRSPMVIAIIAGAIVLVALAIVIALALDSGGGAGGGAPAPAPDAPQTPEPAPPAQTPTTPTPPPAVAPPVAPAPAAPDAGVAGFSARAPTPTAPEPAPNEPDAKASEPAPSEPAAKPTEPAPAEPAPAAPAAAPRNTVVNTPTTAAVPRPELATRFGKVERAPGELASNTALRASATLPSGTQRIVLLVPEFLGSAGISADNVGLTFPWAGFRAIASFEGTAMRIDADATQPAGPELAQQLPTAAPNDGVSAMREILNRLLVEARGANDERLALLQLRQPVRQAIVVGTPCMVRGVPDPSVVVAVMRAGAAEPFAESLVPRGGSMDYDLGGGAGVTIARGDEANAVKVTLKGPTTSEIGVARTRLVQEVTAAERLDKLCTRLAAEAKKMSKPGTMNMTADERDELNNALSPEDRGLMVDAKNNRLPVDHSEAVKIVAPRVGARAKARLDEARAALGELAEQQPSPSGPRRPPEFTLRVMGTDGIVYLDAPLTVVRLREPKK
ncbi:MAG: hypothetical protein U0625_00005 [Phycisphaerales bacterium]